MCLISYSVECANLRVKRTKNGFKKIRKRRLSSSAHEAWKDLKFKLWDLICQSALQFVASCILAIASVEGGIVAAPAYVAAPGNFLWFSTVKILI